MSDSEPSIAAGQVWRSTDKRDNNRTVTIVRHSPPGSHDGSIYSDGTVWVEGMRKPRRMSERHLRATYVLHRDVAKAADLWGAAPDMTFRQVVICGLSDLHQWAWDHCTCGEQVSWPADFTRHVVEMTLAEVDR